MEPLIDLVRLVQNRAEPYPKRHFALKDLRPNGQMPDTNDPAYALIVLEYLRAEVARYTLILRSNPSRRARFAAWRSLRRVETELRRFTASAHALSAQQVLLRELPKGDASSTPRS